MVLQRLKISTVCISQNNLKAPRDTGIIVEGQSAEWKCPNIEIDICIHKIN